MSAFSRFLRFRPREPNFMRDDFTLGRLLQVNLGPRWMAYVSFF